MDDGNAGITRFQAGKNDVGRNLQTLLEWEELF
jgi:hypothetical protein